MKLDATRTTTKRKIGRPPICEGHQTITMSVSVTTTDYDRWSRWALARHIELSPFIRELLAFADRHYSLNK